MAQQSPHWALLFWGASLACWVVEGLWLRWSKSKHGLPLLSVAMTVAPLAVTWSAAGWGFEHTSGVFATLAVIAAVAVLVLVLYAVQSAVAIVCGVAKVRAAIDKAARREAEDTATVETIYDRAPSTEQAHWDVHPSGLRYRSEIVGEIGMGGPATYAHRFDNGVVLGNGSLYIGEHGRYVACTGVDSACDITLMDFETGRSRQWTDCDDARLLCGERGPEHPKLRGRLQSPKAVQWKRAHGLWLHPDVEVAREKIELCDEAGRHRLELEAIFDEAQLRDMADSASYVAQPFYRIKLDGRELSLRTALPDEIVWSKAGDRLLIPAVAQDAGGSHWLWREDADAIWVTPAWQSDRALECASLSRVNEIDSEGLWILFSVGAPRGGGYPNAWRALRSPDSFTYGSYPNEWVRGADEHGRVEVVALTGNETSWRLRLRWDELGQPEALGVVETRRGANGSPAVFEALPSRPDDRLTRYRVRAGKAVAEDVQLFHLWSDCGRFLVLQPYAAGATDTFFVLDTESGRRLDTTYRVAGLQLNSFECGQLQVQAPVGCVPPRYGFGPFEKIGRAPSPNDEGETFAVEDDWLLMESLRFRVDMTKGSIDGPLTKCVRVKKPPFPNAAFAYVYPSPDGKRWVHCFGARDEYNDSYERGQESRYQACAITSDGVCLEGLGAAMIWSQDSRYLFFTTRLPREHADFEDMDWKGRVLDCETRQLHGAKDLKGLAILDQFDADGLKWRWVEVDWWREDVGTTPKHFSMKSLLAKLAQPLEMHGELWLPAGAQRRQDWAALYESSKRAVASFED
ncbi:hypothetical protein VVD49_00765 [Uliginosibacterium sp. H3]|uniref:Uncharacterized protein n=1 Tax=Uliginosibacterium silvisoli TaxID=3114758 RepID=A0ABU6JXC6_9RHOO|nr:hypothetical protein [Uliginosibacterium sp. H3]